MTQRTQRLQRSRARAKAGLLRRDGLAKRAHKVAFCCGDVIVADQLVSSAVHLEQHHELT